MQLCVLVVCDSCCLLGSLIRRECFPAYFECIFIFLFFIC